MALGRSVGRGDTGPLRGPLKLGRAACSGVGAGDSGQWPSVSIDTAAAGLSALLKGSTVHCGECNRAGRTAPLRCGGRDCAGPRLSTVHLVPVPAARRRQPDARRSDSRPPPERERGRRSPAGRRPDCLPPSASATASSSPPPCACVRSVRRASAPAPCRGGRRADRCATLIPCPVVMTRNVVDLTLYTTPSKCALQCEVCRGITFLSASDKNELDCLIDLAWNELCPNCGKDTQRRVVDHPGIASRAA